MKYGTIKIKLDKLLVLKKNCNNKITRLDTDVLARICNSLECEITDLLEFVPPENKH